MVYVYLASDHSLTSASISSCSATNRRLGCFRLKESASLLLKAFASAEVVLFSVDMDFANTALISSSQAFYKFQESLNIYRSHNNLPRNVSSRVQLSEGWLWWVLPKALSLPNCHVKFLDGCLGKLCTITRKLVGSHKEASGFRNIVRISI